MKSGPTKLKHRKRVEKFTTLKLYEKFITDTVKQTYEFPGGAGAIEYVETG